LYPDVDGDGDGCTNQLEVGPDETLGGRRDPTNPHDFYDVTGDGNIDLSNDYFAVLALYGKATATPGYDDFYDRGPTPTGADAWDVSAPDGIIDAIDLNGVINSVGHSCPTLTPTPTP
jgi:hypothetical protein